MPFRRRESLGMASLGNTWPRPATLHRLTSCPLRIGLRSIRKATRTILASQIWPKMNTFMYGCEWQLFPIFANFGAEMTTTRWRRVLTAS
jgi:hypothetical protein